MRMFAFGLLLFSFLCCSAMLWEPYDPVGSGRNGPRTQEPATAILGNPERLIARYEAWKEALADSGQEHRVVLPLSWSKARSVERTDAVGSATLDLAAGELTIEVDYVPALETGLDVWLVEYRPGMGAEYDAQEDELLVHMGTMAVVDGAGAFVASLEDALTGDFELELVALSRAGTTPRDGGLLYGTPGLFQRVYSSEVRAAARAGKEAERRRVGGLLLALAPMAPLPQHPAPSPDETPDDTLPDLVALGERLFCEETFEGNGRTCCSCHPLENNLTIEPLFIATLPATDPLFVAEFVPALDSTLNGGLIFEQPKLMREFGLIVENLDGFGDLTTRFTMRSVPHTLALPTSLNPQPGGLAPPKERTGWSGDGAPGDGTLRDFATGAVTQHFPRTLARDPTGLNPDFRLPTPDELNAMEAFQLSLGRDADPQLATMTFIDADAEAGKEIFNDPGSGKCFLCHFNAGANAQFAAPAGTANFNFDTNVEEFTQNHPDGTGLPRPPDGGFGLNPQGDFTALIPGPDGSFGNGQFNTTPLVELADTLPAFHSNITNIPGSGLPDTVEGAIAFYNTAEFNTSPTGAGTIALSPAQVDQVGAFLRVLNALENERAASEFGNRAKALLNNGGSFSAADQLLELGTFDCDDGIEVLAGGNLHMDARKAFHKARQRFLQATHGPLSHRVAKIDDGLALLADARAFMLL